MADKMFYLGAKFSSNNKYNKLLEVLTGYIAIHNSGIIFFDFFD
jgi:hypothetical protein